MSTLDYAVDLAVPGSIASELEDDWRIGLNHAGESKIKARWDSIVGTSEKWTATVAQTSNANWKAFPNPDYVSKRGRTRDVMVGVQLGKLTSAFDKAKAAHDDVFADSGAKFQAAVTAKSGNWTAAVPQVFALTGDRLFGRRGPASVVVRLAAGDSTYLRDTAGGTAPTGVIDPTVLDPAQVPYLTATTRQAFKAAFEGPLIQIGYNLLKQYITDVTAVNLMLRNLMKGFIPDTSALDDNYIRYSIGAGVTLTLHLDNADVEA